MADSDLPKLLLGPDEVPTEIDLNQDQERLIRFVKAERSAYRELKKELINAGKLEYAHRDDRGYVSVGMRDGDQVLWLETSNAGRGHVYRPVVFYGTTPNGQSVELSKNKDPDNVVWNHDVFSYEHWYEQLKPLGYIQKGEVNWLWRKFLVCFWGYCCQEQTIKESGSRDSKKRKHDDAPGSGTGTTRRSRKKHGNAVSKYAKEAFDAEDEDDVNNEDRGVLNRYDCRSSTELWEAFNNDPTRFADLRDNDNEVAIMLAQGYIASQDLEAQGPDPKTLHGVRDDCAKSIKNGSFVSAEENGKFQIWKAIQTTGAKGVMTHEDFPSQYTLDKQLKGAKAKETGRARRRGGRSKGNRASEQADEIVEQDETRKQLVPQKESTKDWLLRNYGHIKAPWQLEGRDKANGASEQAGGIVEQGGTRKQLVPQNESTKDWFERKYGHIKAP